MRVSAEADQDDAMIKFSSTPRTVKDAMLVVQEDIGIALDCGSDRLLSDGGLQLLYTVWLHIESFGHSYTC